MTSARAQRTSFSITAIPEYQPFFLCMMLNQINLITLRIFSFRTLLKYKPAIGLLQTMLQIRNNIVFSNFQNDVLIYALSFKSIMMNKHLHVIKRIDDVEKLKIPP